MLNENVENKFNPLVSIVIPVYNGEKYVKEAIDSALNQTYKNIEIIVVNDGSTDKSEEIILSYGEKLRYFKKENGGVATALNLAIKEAKGEYISWLSHDDVYFPNKIERQIEELSKLEDKNTILYSNLEYIDENSEFLSKSILHDKYKINDLNKPLYTLLNGLIHGCSLIIRRDILLYFNGFNETLKTVQDYYLWFDIFKEYSVKYMEDVLIKSRDHQEQGCKTLKPIAENEQLVLWNKMIKELTINDVANLTDKKLEYFTIDESKKNVILLYAPKEILLKIDEVNKTTPFTVANLMDYFNSLPQMWNKPKIKSLKQIKNNIFRHLKLFSLIAKMLCSKFGKKNILILEPNLYHAETFVGYIKYFIDLGYNVHLVADEAIRDENPFCRFFSEKLKIFYTPLTNFIIVNLLASRIINKYDHVLITSSLCYSTLPAMEMHRILNDRAKRKLFLVEHDMDNVSKVGEGYLIQDNKLWTLLPRNFQNGLKTTMVNPHYFGKVNPTKINKDFINFVAVGVIDKDYRNHSMLEEVIRKLISEGIENFKITIVGSGDLPEFSEDIKKYISFKGRLNFCNMFKEIETANYYLYLLNPNLRMHRRYLNKLVTGSLQLVLGFKILPVIDKFYAENYGLNENNAILYENNDLYSGLVKAIKTNEEEYNLLQSNLKQYADRIYSESLENIKNATE